MIGMVLGLWSEGVSQRCPMCLFVAAWMTFAPLFLVVATVATLRPVKARS